MTYIWIGALLFIAGVVITAVPPIWQARMSRPRQLNTGRAGATLEPERPAKGLGIRSNWPGLAMIVVGAALMLFGAAF